MHHKELHCYKMNCFYRMSFKHNSPINANIRQIQTLVILLLIKKTIKKNLYYQKKLVLSEITITFAISKAK